MENYEKIKKTEKEMICETIDEFGSWLCMGKVLAPHRACPKTVPLIKCGMFIFPRNKNKIQIRAKIIILN